jgi:hypothetical protein
MDASTFISLFKQYGLPYLIIAIFLFLVIYLLRILLDENQSALWRGRLYRAAFSVSRKREHEKKFISNDINGRINLARNKLHFGKDLLPKSVKVEWIEGTNGGTYDLKEGEFVVCLNPAHHQEINIVRLATAVAERTSLIGIRGILEKPLATAIDLNLVKNILCQLKNKRILDWFLTQEYQLSVQRDAKLSTWNGKIAEIDEKGLFTRILLIELDSFAKKIFGMAHKPFMAGEVEGLVNFLYLIATKQFGQQVPLDYICAYIKIAVVLVADTSKILSGGIERYVKAVNYELNKKINTVYAIIFEKEWLKEIDPKAEEEFTKLVKNLDNAILQSSRINKDFEVKYSCMDTLGRRRSAKCIRYTIQPLPQE